MAKAEPHHREQGSAMKLRILFIASVYVGCWHSLPKMTNDKFPGLMQLSRYLHNSIIGKSGCLG
jgi:hypothetical protein